MTTEQVVAIAGNAASLILAIVAIWLAIKFYQIPYAGRSNRNCESLGHVTASGVIGALSLTPGWSTSVSWRHGSNWLRPRPRP